MSGESSQTAVPEVQAERKVPDSAAARTSRLSATLLELMSAGLQEVDIQRVARPSTVHGLVEGSLAKPFTFSSTIQYGSPEAARMVRDALNVDAELRPEQVSRRLLVDQNKLIIKFEAVDVRTLRAAVGTFCDLLGLATRTLEAFGTAALTKTA